MSDLQEIIGKYEETRKRYQNDIASKFSTSDYFNFNEILFSAYSCAIEGNSFSVDDTKELKEHGLQMKLQNKSMFEAFEILDHFNAFEFLMNNLNKPLSEQLLIQTHQLLTKNTILYSKGYQPGEYTKTRMAAGDTIFPDHEKSIQSIASLLESTEAALSNEHLHPVEISAKFHQFFIYLHPFPDGNGRIARLFSNFILSKKNHPLIIITNEQKKEYISALKQTQKHNDMNIISTFFLNSSIQRMTHELKQNDSDITHTQQKKNKGMSFIF
ncbi:MAG: Fic family protein [Bacteroidota bacterium]